MSDANPLRIAKCFACTEVPSGICRRCGAEFCEKHRSRYNDAFCRDCAGDESTRFEEQPLINDEGTHNGRALKLIGEGWPNQLEMIGSLTDEELEAKLEQWQKLLQKAIITQEFWRISVAAAKYETEERKYNKRRKRERAERKVEQGVLNVNKKRTKIVDPAVAVAKQLNITVEQARALMSHVKAKGVRP